MKHQYFGWYVSGGSSKRLNSFGGLCMNEVHGSESMNKQPYLDRPQE